MSVYTQLHFYVKTKTPSHRERLQFFLDPRTRPDFVDEVNNDEVNNDEAHLVELFEEAGEPFQISKLSANELYFHIEDGGGNDKDYLEPALKSFAPDAAMLWEETEEGENYFSSFDVEEDAFELFL